MQILSGHISPETSYLVDSYPYGRTLRCKIRYWLDCDPKKGARLVSQTTNPKLPGEVWNKPKASTYCRFAGCMYLDEKGHVQWTGMSEYMDLTELTAWFEKFGEGVPASLQRLMSGWIKVKTAFETAKANAAD